jgi:hypothetical protein
MIDTVLTDTTHKKMLDELLASCRNNLPKVKEDLIKKSFQLSLESHKKIGNSLNV